MNYQKSILNTPDFQILWILLKLPLILYTIHAPNELYMILKVYSTCQHPTLDNTPTKQHLPDKNQVNQEESLHLTSVWWHRADSATSITFVNLTTYKKKCSLALKIHKLEIQAIENEVSTVDVRIRWYWSCRTTTNKSTNHRHANTENS